jgi:hypothetical protein
MTTTFYPVGTWHEPEGRYITDYSHMSKGDPNAQTRSTFTTGYAGHQPDVKYKYGYGTVGPDRDPRVQAEVDPEIPLPDPISRHEMRETDTAKKLAEIPVYMNRTNSVPAYARDRHKSMAMKHYFPKSLESAGTTHCPAAYLIKNPTAQEGGGMKRLMRSTSHQAFTKRDHGTAGCIDYVEPITMPFGGTGYDACAGIVNTWWPKERAEANDTLANMLKQKYSTSTGRTYLPKNFHRPLFQ